MFQRTDRTWQYDDMDRLLLHEAGHVLIDRTLAPHTRLLAAGKLQTALKDFREAWGMLEGEQRFNSIEARQVALGSRVESLQCTLVSLMGTIEALLDQGRGGQGDLPEEDRYE